MSLKLRFLLLNFSAGSQTMGQSCRHWVGESTTAGAREYVASLRSLFCDP